MWWDEFTWMRFRRGTEKEWKIKNGWESERDCERDEKIEVLESWHEFTMYEQNQHRTASTRYLCGCMSSLSNMAWWCFTITQFLASYKVCMLFYYPLHDDVPLHDVAHKQPQTVLPLLRSAVPLCVWVQSSCSCSHLLQQLRIHPSSFVYVQNQIQYKHIMWEFQQNCFKFLIDKNVMRNECIRAEMGLFIAWWYNNGYLRCLSRIIHIVGTR